MIQQSHHNKRIAKNTILLYFRMLFIMGVSLYTSRVVLSMLGVEDYGVYNVVGGTVALLGVLSSSLSTASLRFLTFELGRNNYTALQRVFSLSLTIHFGLALAVLLVAELAGVWFLNTRLNIPVERLYAANWVFQCSALSFFVTVLGIPFDALMIAHERMAAFAYMGILDVLLKLLLILGLAHFTFLSDKLLVYGVILMSVTILTQFIYACYCRKYFPECRYSFVWDKLKLREMTGFAGWSFIGSGALVLRDQGVNILLNIFCGPVVNAARGISYSVNNAVNSFVGNFMVALNPQITKSYAAGDRCDAESLVSRGSRFSFYILLVLALPILFETNFILSLWLNKYPDYAVSFVRLLLILSLMDSLSNTLNTLQLATGRIRNYQLSVGGMALLNFPFSYLFLWLGYAPEITVVIAISLSFVCLIVRLLFLRRTTGLSVRSYLGGVVWNVILVSACALPLPWLVYHAMSVGTLRFILLTTCSALWTSGIVYGIGCCAGERTFLRQRCGTVWKKISNVRISNRPVNEKI